MVNSDGTVSRWLVIVGLVFLLNGCQTKTPEPLAQTKPPAASPASPPSSDPPDNSTMTIQIVATPFQPPEVQRVLEAGATDQVNPPAIDRWEHDERMEALRQETRTFPWLRSDPTINILLGR